MVPLFKIVCGELRPRRPDQLQSRALRIHEDNRRVVARECGTGIRRGRGGVAAAPLVRRLRVPHLRVRAPHPLRLRPPPRLGARQRHARLRHQRLPRVLHRPFLRLHRPEAEDIRPLRRQPRRRGHRPVRRASSTSAVRSTRRTSSRSRDRPPALPQFVPPLWPGICIEPLQAGRGEQPFITPALECFAQHLLSRLREMNGLMSFSVNDWRANGGGLRWERLRGDEYSPGTSDCGTGRSSMGQSGYRSAGSKTKRNPCLVACATTSMFLPL